MRKRPKPLRISGKRNGDDYLPSGQTRINITGVPGVNFMLQASTDLFHWATLCTNKPPTTIYDDYEGGRPRC